MFHLAPRDLAESLTMHSDIIEQVLFDLRTRSGLHQRSHKRRLQLSGSDSEHYRQTIESLATELLGALRHGAIPTEPGAPPVPSVLASMQNSAVQTSPFSATNGSVAATEPTRPTSPVKSNGGPPVTFHDVGSLESYLKAAGATALSDARAGRCEYPRNIQDSARVLDSRGSLKFDPCVWDINLGNRRDGYRNAVTLALTMQSWLPARPQEITRLNLSERTAMQADEERPSSNDPGVMPSLPAEVFMEVYSAVIGDEVLHFVTLGDGSTDEDWGPKGIERLLEKHLNDDRRLLHAHFAQHFFRKINAMMTGEYTLTVDVTVKSDVENIRITRPGQVTAHYRHRFDLFESGGWWLN